MVRLALDIDKTITAAPKQLAALARSVIEAGGRVLIVHASGHPGAATAQDVAVAKAKLSAAGFDGLYHALYCAPKPTAKNKARYCAAQRVTLFLDDRKKNVRKVAKAGVPAARFVGPT